MIRSMLAAALLCSYSSAFAPMWAQTSPWTHEGVTFPQTAGWCPGKVEEDDGAGGKTTSIRIPVCGQEFPALTAGIGARGAAAQDLSALTTSAAASAAGDEGKATVDGIFKKKSSTCTRQTYTLDSNPVRNLPAFEINATYTCPALDPQNYQFHNVTAYAQQKNGDLWIVAFDSDSATLTADQEDLIRGAVAAIKAR